MTDTPKIQDVCECGKPIEKHLKGKYGFYCNSLRINGKKFTPIQSQESQSRSKTTDTIISEKKRLSSSGSDTKIQEVQEEIFTQEQAKDMIEVAYKIGKSQTLKDLKWRSPLTKYKLDLGIVPTQYKCRNDWFVCEGNLKSEAIKWVKKLNGIMSQIDKEFNSFMAWKTFFNITEEDLK